MGITKKAKRVKVKRKEIVGYQAMYTCPSCNTTFSGFGPDSNVIRFRCKCGQELIVDN